MSKWIYLTGALLAVFMTAFLLPGCARAADTDTKAVLSYTLTEAGLGKYTQATRKLAALSAACDDDTDTAADSVDSVVAKLNATPGAQAAIQSAGMTTREYVLFSWSLVHNDMAAWAASQPGGTLPPDVSKANVDFVNQHDAELQSLGQLTESSDCDEAVTDGG